MHEIAIAESIIEIAEAKAREAKARSIRMIKLRLGEFTTIVQEALEFAFEVARQGTLASNARLEVESVPMVVQCVVCGIDTGSVTEMRFMCSQCGFPLKIVSGEELQIEYIEVETEEEYRNGTNLSSDQCTER
jgi:hydrogenase nickel incorporation protein HypA/HybF